jgi:hypothetical protein
MTFEDDLEYSLDERRSEFFNSVYMHRWPQTVSIEPIDDLDFQKLGVDKVLHQYDGTFVYIEEKTLRWAKGKIFIETESQHEKGVPGWIYTTHSDFVAYYLVKENDIHLLNTVLLKKAWTRNCEEWSMVYGETEVPNSRYTTVGVYVPVPVLYTAIGEARQLNRMDTWAVR